MPRVSQIVPCVDCGEEFPRKELNRNRRCHECAWAAMMDAPEQLLNHEGRYYEKWKVACIAMADRYREGVKGG